jgi:hypothetical protein
MKRLALLCLCVAMGVVACTGSSSAAPSPSPTVKVTAGPSIAPSGKDTATVAANYYRAIVRQKYRSAFTYLAANATGPGGSRLTLPAFLQLARMMDGMGGPVTHFSVAAIQSMIVMTLDRQKYGPYHAHLQMARHRGGWTIASIDRI